MDRFHLTWQDALEVEAAVREGRATRPGLQPAARGFAEHALTPPTFRGRPITTYPVATRWAWLVVAIAAVAFLAYAAALGSELTIAYLIIYGTVTVLSIAARRRRRRRPHRQHPQPRPSVRPRRPLNLTGTVPDAKTGSGHETAGRAYASRCEASVGSSLELVRDSAARRWDRPRTWW